MERTGAQIAIVERARDRHPLAHVAGPDAHDHWDRMVAPRHFKTLNVLFVDGHVDSCMPDEIDPRVLTIHDDLWWPANMQSAF